MIAITRRFRVLLSVYFAHMLEYRAEIFLWAISNVIPFFMMGLWVAASSSPDADFALAPVEFARYFIALFVVRQCTIVWVIWDFEAHVVEGRLSPYLLQPMDPVWRFVSGHIAERGARFPFSVALLGLFFVIYPAAWWIPHWVDIALASVAIIMAFALRFAMQYTVAMASFWIERAAAFEEMSFIFYMFLSGMIAPLEIFPPAVREVALWTPFPYLIYFPAALLTGRLVFNPWQGFSVMAAWLLIFVCLNRWLWRRGLKRYSAMGA